MISLYMRQHITTKKFPTKNIFPFLLNPIAFTPLRMDIEYFASFVLPNYTEYNSGYLILFKLILNEEMSPSGFSVTHK